VPARCRRASRCTTCTPTRPAIPSAWCLGRGGLLRSIPLPSRAEIALNADRGRH
jgi:hypothetical protein